MTTTAPDPGTADRVLHHHTRMLRAHAEQHPDNPRFVTGIAWGLYALERVARALSGVTDRAELGLGEQPLRPPPIEPTPATRPSITCPLCRRTSWHPEDVRHGYCGACHAVTSPLAARAAGIVELIERSSLGTPAARAARARVSDARAAQIVEQADQLGAAVDVAAAALDASIGEFVDARADGEFDANPREAARVAVEALYLAGLLRAPAPPATHSTTRKDLA